MNSSPTQEEVKQEEPPVVYLPLPNLRKLEEEFQWWWTCRERLRKINYLTND